MEIKISVKSSETERDNLNTLCRECGEMVDESCNYEDAVDYVKEAINSIHTPDGRDFPGYYAKAEGTVSDGSITLSIMEDDFIFFTNMMRDVTTHLKPIFTLGKTIIHQAISLGTTFRDMGNRCVQRFARPVKYSIMDVDATTRYGFIVGAVYRDDGYETKEVYRTHTTRHDCEYFDEVATSLLEKRVKEGCDLIISENIGDAIEALKDDIGIYTDSYIEYRGGLVEYKNIAELQYGVAAIIYATGYEGYRSVVKSTNYGNSPRKIESGFDLDNLGEFECLIDKRLDSTKLNDVMEAYPKLRVEAEDMVTDNRFGLRKGEDNE